MARWDTRIFGCPQATAFSASRGTSTVRHEVLMGRPRHRLRSDAAPFVVNMMFEMKTAVFIEWQRFWESDLNYGELWFEMPMKPNGTVLEDEWIEYHAVGPFTATGVSFDHWTVALTVETASS